MATIDHSREGIQSGKNMPRLAFLDLMATIHVDGYIVVSIFSLFITLTMMIMSIWPPFIWREKLLIGFKAIKLLISSHGGAFPKTLSLDSALVFMMMLLSIFLSSNR